MTTFRAIRTVIMDGGMQDFAEYRATDQETIVCLIELRDDLKQAARGVGDLRPTLIDAAIERTLEHPWIADRIGVNKPFALNAKAPKRAPSRRFVAMPMRLHTWLTGARR